MRFSPFSSLRESSLLFSKRVFQKQFRGWKFPAEQRQEGDGNEEGTDDDHEDFRHSATATHSKSIVNITQESGSGSGILIQASGGKPSRHMHGSVDNVCSRQQRAATAASFPK